ncbi:MAG: pyruvate ferredoxin oxidoreductase [Thermoplasmata archaeon]|nr:pyruvate ferredoxin oxidoreductase [Thermoplasmata archaeon]
MKDEWLFAPGHGMCAGCVVPALVKHILAIAGKNTFVVNSTGCLEVATTEYPRTSWKVPWVHVAFENSAAVASGIEAAMKKFGEEGNIICFAGDGGTADIGMQALSGMVERGHDVLYVMYDNEAYMNTGIQRSGATPYGAWTTTSEVGKANPIGNLRPKKPVADIIAAHKAAYVATVNLAFFQDFKKKVEKAMKVKGPRFLHAIVTCPTGWRADPSKGIEIMRLATETGIFPLWENENGGKKRITYRPKKFKPVKEYFKLQSRFRHLSDDIIEKIQEDVDRWWKEHSE